MCGREGCDWSGHSCGIDWGKYINPVINSIVVTVFADITVIVFG